LGRMGVTTVRDLDARWPAGHVHRRRVPPQVWEARERIPEVTSTEEPHFVLAVAQGSRDMRNMPFKDMYLAFRDLVDTYRHYEQKWEEALGRTLGGQWPALWGGLHKSGASVYVKTASRQYGTRLCLISGRATWSWPILLGATGFVGCAKGQQEKGGIQ
jgi:hypothetical protein